ncbi:MAG: hypothetical protein IPP48_11285 [Chitinophagaceae bacterium]|nr:hypothetical protein [Chitinophagaceae bacterium]
MNTIATPEIREVMEAVHYRPAVSIILPFEPKMSSKFEIASALKAAATKVEKELKNNYPNELSSIVIEKLSRLIKDLNFGTHKKSIAIYVSPVFEKVLYLDIALEEKIIIDESFEIRDLVYCKKQLHKFLILMLSSKECRIFLGNSENFARILINTHTSIFPNENDIPERVANFTNIQDRKEILMDKFVHQVDNELEPILNNYHLPLFVLGTKRISGHFSKITRHTNAIIEYIHGNYEETTTHELKQVLEPYIKNWQNTFHKELLTKIEAAADTKKLATGIKNVWHDAMNLKGKLLVVEKNYMYAAQQSSNKDIIYKIAHPYNTFSFIKDAVDDVIEKVLENGGDIEFVDEGVLTKYNHIALIEYY